MMLNKNLRPGLSFSIAVAILFLAGLACNTLLPEIDVPAAPGLPTENPYTEVPRIELEIAVAAFDTGAAVFVDVRGEDQYAQSHVPGALSIPLSQIAARMGELDPDDWIITYCT